MNFRTRFSRMSRQAAFTLVELLVVIGVISLLISILMPSLRRAREAAYTTQCLSNVRQIGLAAMMYVNDHRGYLLTNFDMSYPPSVPTMPDPGIYVVNGYPGASWYDILFTNYLNRNIRIFECPKMTVQRPSYYQAAYPYGPREFFPGYGVNGACATVYVNPVNNGPPWGPQKALHYTQFKNPGQKIWYADSGLTVNDSADPYPYSLTYNNQIAPVESFRLRLGVAWWACLVNSANSGMLSGRHGKWKAERGNAYFFDGHAETVNCRDVWADVSMASAPYWYASGPHYAMYWDPDGDGMQGTPKPW